MFSAISVWVLAVDLYQVAAHGRVWTGTDGLFLADQMQYLAWIKDASHNVLASNLFVLRGTPHDYLQPIVVISGAITAAGVAPWLSLLLWKPIAVAGGFIAVRAYVRRTMVDRFDRNAALVLALFFGFFGVIGDEWLPFWSWGYPFGLLAIAAVVGSLLSYERARARGAVTWIAPVLGLLAAFIHPWQGELLILIIIGAELASWRPRHKHQEPTRAAGDDGDRDRAPAHLLRAASEVRQLVVRWLRSRSSMTTRCGRS